VRSQARFETSHLGRLNFRHKFEEISPFGTILLSCKNDTCAVQRREPTSRDTADLVLAGAVGDHNSFARQNPEDDRICVRVLDDLLGPVNDGSGLNFCTIVHRS